MATLIPDLRRLAGRRKPAVLNRCPVCKRDVTEADEPLRLTGRTYVHYGCGTYTVRRIRDLGGYRR
jgi:hypothetical protein